MLSIPQAEARAAALVEAALRAGADAADAAYVGQVSTGVQVRLGQPESVDRAEGEEVGLRFFLGRRSASASSSDLSADALGGLVERVAAMAREALEDPFAGLAPEDRLLRGPLPDIDADDGGEESAVALRERALATEAAARAVPGVTNSEGAGAGFGRTVFALATSHGFARGHTSSGYSGSASVIAGTGAGMQRDYASHSARHHADLDAPAAIGSLAAERAVKRLNPAKLASGAMPIVFDPRVGGSLVGHLISAMSGAAIARRTSFLVGREGERLFAPGVTIRDDPHRPRGLRSRPFDGEGLATAPTDLVADGELGGWLMDSAAARQLGRAPTGHAARGVSGAPGVSASNVDLLPGTLSPAALIGDIRHGVYVTELIGQGINLVTGDYSRGASGFLIADGAIGPPVAEITIAGNLADMFAALVPADDLERRRALNVPTIRIDGMTVAGA